MKNMLLTIAAICAGLLLAFTLYEWTQAGSRTDARICLKVDRLDSVIVALLERSQKSLPTNPFYRDHPELLAAAKKQNARALREFRGAACANRKDSSSVG